MAILRDTLGNGNPDDDRLMAVWLLTYAPPTIPKRLLSAVPFFYWRVGKGPSKVSARDLAPILDLTSLQHPMLNSVGRDLLQWTMLDPSTTPIRATSRAYRTNEVDHERLHLEEAVSYLRTAPSDQKTSGLSESDLRTLIARLELRKTLLGGFVSRRGAAVAGEEDAARFERIRSRNWELLRECAERTGLYFEPLQIAGSSGEYAILWYPVEGSNERAGPSLSSAWKLLSIKNPWTDERLKSGQVKGYKRQIDENGELLPEGVSGSRTITLIPLSVYSLSYPKTPLLLVDFRDGLHVRWHEMTQRTINEVTAGIIGISHFTNWYYYVAADLYDFIVSRHGGAMNQAQRLDCYSQFRVKLALDHQLDVSLRAEMQQRIDSLAVNPLEASPQQEMRLAVARYDRLIEGADDAGRLPRTLDKDRRAELAYATETQGQIWRDDLLHLATLGIYTHRVKPNAANLGELAAYRTVEHHLEFLREVEKNGTQPEVAFNPAQIRLSVSELQNLMPRISSPSVRVEAVETLSRLRGLSQDEIIQANCSAVLASLQQQPYGKSEQIALEPAAIRVPSFLPATPR